MQRRRPDVLVVDDEHSCTELVALLLDSEYEVRQVWDAAGALLAIGLRPPAVLVTDLAMPGYGGEELLADVQRDFPCVLRVAYSSAPISELRRIAGTTLADASVQKSGHIQPLLHAIRELLASGDHLCRRPSVSASVDSLDQVGGA